MMSVDELLSALRDEMRRTLSRQYQAGYEEGIGAAQPILTRLIACADDGYDMAKLNRIVADARKAVGR